MSWISVKDRIPETNQRVFAKGVFGLDDNAGFGVGEITYKDGDYVSWSAGSRSLVSVTHWMPFDEPKDES